MKHLPVRTIKNRSFLFVLLFGLGNQIGLSQEPLAVFKGLVGKTWKAEGEWTDGFSFKQESAFSYALDSTLVIVESKGYTDQEQTKFGDRNHGIRKWNAEKGILEFWEFDVFGGVTWDKILVEDKNLRYEYVYGETLVSDYWEFMDDNTYNFKVGNYIDGEWKQVYLETQFKSIQK